MIDRDREQVRQMPTPSYAILPSRTASPSSRFVDAVAGHRDDLPLGLQRAHPAQHVLGIGACEGRHTYGQFAQTGVVAGLDLRSGDGCRAGIGEAEPATHVDNRCARLSQSQRIRDLLL
jgi:hypothetical protein